MKLAIVGKGGVGKTTLSASVASWLSRRGRPVVAVDADPDGNLAAAMGVPADDMPEPIAAMKELIQQRTDAKDQGAGLMFKLNPKVDDLPDKFSVDLSGVRLLVLGTVESGGKGCMCPEGALLKALMQHLLLRIPDDVILDMEAGLEHMGRASATGVDALISVVEPGMRSVQTANRIQRLARDIGIGRTFVVANRIRETQQQQALQQALAGQTIAGVLPYCDDLARADLHGRAAETQDPAFTEAFERMMDTLQGQINSDE